MSDTKNTKKTQNPKELTVQHSTQASGNNDQKLSEKLKSIRSRKWFVTIFNLTQKIQDYIESAEKWIWAKEICPTTKKEHWHAYLEFENARTKYTLAKHLGKGQIEKARGKLKECMNYVSKDGNFKTNIKLPKPVKIITELYQWQKDLVALLNTEPDDRTVNWYYSIEGAKGKTQMAKYLAINHKALIIGGKASDIANGLKNYHTEHECYPDVVLMNLSRDVKSLSYKGLEQIKDGLVVNTKYECSQHIFNSPHLIVFANIKPDTSKLSKDRWNIINLDS